MAKIRTMSLILCLSILVGGFGLLRINSVSKDRGVNQFTAEYNSKTKIDKIDELSNVANDKNKK